MGIQTLGVYIYISSKGWRGFFTKCYEKDLFLENGIDITPYEELRSFSRKGVIRTRNCKN